MALTLRGMSLALALLVKALALSFEKQDTADAKW